MQLCMAPNVCGACKLYIVRNVNHLQKFLKVSDFKAPEYFGCGWIIVKPGITCLKVLKVLTEISVDVLVQHRGHVKV